MGDSFRNQCLGRGHLTRMGATGADFRQEVDFEVFEWVARKRSALVGAKWHDPRSGHRAAPRSPPHPCPPSAQSSEAARGGRLELWPESASPGSGRGGTRTTCRHRDGIRGPGLVRPLSAKLRPVFSGSGRSSDPPRRELFRVLESRPPKEGGRVTPVPYLTERSVPGRTSVQADNMPRPAREQELAIEARCGPTRPMASELRREGSVCGVRSVGSL